jgi:exodeoxyribonuclease VII small subunit
MAVKKTTRSKLHDFEAALEELEKIIQRMEQGDQTLEVSLQDFERGMELSRTCRKSLDDAEQRIEQLVKKHGEYTVEPLDTEDPG